jgi:hypothetical protein
MPAVLTLPLLHYNEFSLFRSYDLRKPEKSGDIAGHKLNRFNQFNQFNGTITEQYTEQETRVVVCSALTRSSADSEYPALTLSSVIYCIRIFWKAAACQVQFISPRLAQLSLMFLLFDQR